MKRRRGWSSEKKTCDMIRAEWTFKYVFFIFAQMASSIDFSVLRRCYFFHICLWRFLLFIFFSRVFSLEYLVAVCWSSFSYYVGYLVASFGLNNRTRDHHYMTKCLSTFVHERLVIHSPQSKYEWFVGRHRFRRRRRRDRSDAFTQNHN